MLNFIYYPTAILLFLISLSSCSQVTDPNKDFTEKYSPQVQNILGAMPQGRYVKHRADRKEEFGAITHQDIMNEAILKDQQYYPYFDVRKFGQKPPQTYFPNMEVYDHSYATKPSSQIPADIFEVSYETRHYPAFKYQGARFDAIKIPEKDMYGVVTNMTHKEYLLAGNNSVLNSIENIKNNRNIFDSKNSKLLIAEQKRLRHEKKIEKIFGVSSINPEDIKDSKKDVTMKEQKDDQNS